MATDRIDQEELTAELVRRGFLKRYEDGLCRWTPKRDDPQHKEELDLLVYEYFDNRPEE
jgi:hypothetical protein